MKLLFCNVCKDVLLIRPDRRVCSCGKSAAVLLDSRLKAKIEGPEAIPLGINNHSFSQAFLARPDEGVGSEFSGFVIPKQCENVVWDPRPIVIDDDELYARITSDKSREGAGALFTATGQELIASFHPDGTPDEDI